MQKMQTMQMLVRGAAAALADKQALTVPTGVSLRSIRVCLHPDYSIN
jgi:hypothetical protein